MDHESGGLGKQGTVFPRMMALGQIDDTRLTRRVGAVMAKEVSSVGVDIMLAPVCDVNTHLDNPIIGARAFSRDSDTVAAHCLAFARGVMDEQVIPVLKHFPGHGATTIDSHLGLPVIDLSKHDLQTHHMAPFKRAFEHHIPMVMTAHIVVEALDKRAPATLSKQILTTYLREELKFKGLVVSDHLEMKAVLQDRSMAEVAFHAWLAGVDILMMDGNFSEVKQLHQLFKEALASGKIQMATIDQRLTRLIELKHQFNNKKTHQQLDLASNKTLRHPDHLNLSSKVIKESIQKIGKRKCVCFRAHLIWILKHIE